jgi:hypothetical protein
LESKPSALIGGFAVLSPGKPPQRDHRYDDRTPDAEKPIQAGETADIRVVERLEFFDSALEIFDESLVACVLGARVEICSGLVGHVAPRRGCSKVAPS